MRQETHRFLEESWQYMRSDIFQGFVTSRTLRSTQLSQVDIDEAVRMGKFELCDSSSVSGAKLTHGFHGVNVFSVPELKGRRRLITEPLLNAVIDSSRIPNVSYPTRLERRQSLRYAAYMLQIDFEAFYDSIPLAVDLRNLFVFRKGDKYYRLLTLPTGARWSVAVGQSVTWAIVDIPTTVIIHTMIDNIMIAAKVGQEQDFLLAVRSIVSRIERANLLTSPDRNELVSATDDELLQMALAPNTFIGEEYMWNGDERIIRNSVKTVAKLGLALQAERFTCRSFVSLISLILYAIHTTRLNPASAFQLLRAYRGVYRSVTEGIPWDSELRHINDKVYAKLLELGQKLHENEWWQIADVVEPTYDELYYNYVIVTDASYSGWGAYIQKVEDGHTMAYQQKWERDLVFDSRPLSPDMVKTAGFFNAHHSAHAEPLAAQLALKQLLRNGIADGSRIALITDHIAIAHAQRRLNGFGGIGRGYTLNKLFEFVYDLWFRRNIQVTFFHLSGKVNPADAISRHFGENTAYGVVHAFPAPYTQLPLLSSTYSPVCEKLSFKGERRK